MSKPPKFISLADLAALTGKGVEPPPSHAAKDKDLVYSTDAGRIKAGPPPAAPIADGSAVRVRREKHGRGGKIVTTIIGLPLDNEGLKALAKELKHSLGGGGTVKDAIIELQGDHRDKVVELLQGRGFSAKAAGG